MCDMKSISNDPVNHPSHYLRAAITIEPIELTSRLDSCLGQALQYVLRAPYKGNQREDLEKAMFYLTKEIFIVNQDCYGSTKSEFEVAPYVFLFKRHTTGLEQRVLEALFGNDNATVHVDGIEDAIRLIRGQIEMLSRIDGDSHIEEDEQC